jgi:hypothetical protein
MKRDVLSEDHGLTVTYVGIPRSPAVRQALLVTAAGYGIVGLFGGAYGVISLFWPQLTTSTTAVIAALIAAPAALALVWPHLATVKAFGLEVAIAHATKEPLPGDVADSFIKVVGFSVALREPEADTGLREPQTPADVTTTAYLPPILDELRTATADQFVTVDLGAGDNWLSTRLYLLAAIADDFLRIPRFVFTQRLPRDEFVGLASPAAVKTSLGLALPADVDAAYTQARREAADLPVGDRLRRVGVRFANLVTSIEWPEGQTSRFAVPWVTYDLLYEWMTAAGKALDTRAILITGLSQQQFELAVALETEDPYIALVDASRQVRGVVDRLDILGQRAAARARAAGLVTSHLPDHGPGRG